MLLILYIPVIIFQVIIVAALLTFLFKKDIDTSDYEEDIGEKESRPEGLKLWNPGG